MKTIHVSILAAAVVIAAFVFGLFFYNARTASGVSVVGAATRRFESDIVKWRITLSRIAPLENMSPSYRLLQGDLAALREELISKGIGAEEISIQPVNTMSNYGREGQITGYTLQQSIFAITSNVAAVEDLALNPTALTEAGLILQNSNLEYFYSKLAEIKMELLALATEDAHRRAEEIARGTGASLGDVTALRSGVFQITEPFSTEVSDYGMYNTQTKQKEIAVTVRATFGLK